MNNIESQKIRHYLVIGKVQGVGYRNYTRKKALQLNLEGWVKNLANGNVEALAKGNEQELETFELILKRGPLLARVSEIQMQEVQENQNLSNTFIIIR